MIFSVNQRLQSKQRLLLMGFSQEKVMSGVGGDGEWLEREDPGGLVRAMGRGQTTATISS